MKPFNLEAAKNGAKLITRDGRPARIVCWDRKDKDYPLLALLENEEGDHEVYYSFTLNGQVFWEEEDDCDLFMAPTQHEGYLNIRKIAKTMGCACGGRIYEDKETADAHATTDRVACVHIEWEE